MAFVNLCKVFGDMRDLWLNSVAALKPSGRLSIQSSINYIFISALALPGGQAERVIINGRVTLYISKAIIHEVLGVLAEKFSRGPEDLQNGTRPIRVG